MTVPRIRVVELTKFYRDSWTWKKIPALQELNMEIECGEIFALLGPNGVGKTTTLKLLAGLLRPSRGRIYWEGREVNWGDRLHVSFLPEEPYFYDHLTVQESLELYGVLWGLSKAERRSRIGWALERTALEGQRGRLIRTLSKGTHQRLGMAQILLHPCDVVLLDEPMSGLDPVGRRQFRDIICSLKQEGRSVLFSTHVLSDVEEIADRAGILAEGQLKEIIPLGRKGLTVDLEEVFFRVVQGQRI